ncbi:hypothetical protein [Candidatus Palauibacter sp.]|uniref:hypothetical protein n=1 Tax=Candidatus Palauibacter sp. TaxID=3101350 RepID=UPI003C704C1D
MRIFLDTNVLVSALAGRGICSDVPRVVIANHSLIAGETVLLEQMKASDRLIRHEPTRPLAGVLRELNSVAEPHAASVCGGAARHYI